MNFENYQKENQQLVNNPEYFRKDQEGEYSWDGIVAQTKDEYAEWVNAPVKVAFLMKEAHGGYHSQIPSEIKDNIGYNIARWKYLIWEFKYNNKVPSFPTNEELKTKYNNTNLGIAIIEVKKYDENQKASSPAEILDYARKDKNLLQGQLELIKPEIIVCCGTFDAYENGIFQENKKNIIHIKYIDLREKYNNVHGSIYTHNNRLILNFFHPAASIDSVGMYNLLGKLLKSVK